MGPVLRPRRNISSSGAALPGIPLYLQYCRCSPRRTPGATEALLGWKKKEKKVKFLCPHSKIFL